MPASSASYPPRRRSVACDQAAGIRDRAGPVHFAFAFVLLSTTVLLTFLFIFISIGVGAGDPGDDAWGPAYLMMILFPLSFGVAVLRYRLYEIDRSCPDGVVCAGRRIVGRSVPGHRRVDVLSAADRVIGPCRGRLDAGRGCALQPAAKEGPGWGGPPVQSPALRRPAGLWTASPPPPRPALDPEEVMTGWVGVVSSTMQPDAIGMWMRDDDGADAGPSP